MSTRLLILTAGFGEGHNAAARALGLAGEETYGPATFLPLQFENLHVVEDHIHESPRGRYLVLHGDIFDTVTKHFVFLAHLGDWGYRALLTLNRFYNAWRAWRGKEYWSLSRAIKARVKEAVSHISKFEEHIAQLARQRGCVGIMCGHIHTAADKMIDDVHYLNSGDWVESLTAIVEHWDGRFELINYTDFVRQYQVYDDDLGVDPAIVDFLGEVAET